MVVRNVSQSSPQRLTSPRAFQPFLIILLLLSAVVAAVGGRVVVCSPLRHLLEKNTSPSPRVRTSAAAGIILWALIMQVYAFRSFLAVWIRPAHVCLTGHVLPAKERVVCVCVCVMLKMEPDPASPLPPPASCSWWWRRFKLGGTRKKKKAFFFVFK